VGFCKGTGHTQLSASHGPCSQVSLLSYVPPLYLDSGARSLLTLSRLIFHRFSTVVDAVNSGQRENLPAGRFDFRRSSIYFPTSQRSMDCDAGYLRSNASSDIMHTMISRRPRRIGIVWFLVLVVAGCIGLYLIRQPILRAAGWALVVNDPVEPADIIVVPLDADGGGVLEAADLVHEGIATRVAVFAELPDNAVDKEFLRRGVTYEDAATRSIRALKMLGVGNVEQIPRFVSGTEDEGPALAEWCAQHQFHSVVVVSSSDHSRRLRRVLSRAMKDQSTRVAVRCARYSIFDPDRWWETHDGIRIEIEEFEKLLLDFLRHPIS